MFEIIMTVCLAATGEDCRDYKLTDKQYESVTACIRDSHGKADAWQRENTKFTLIGTRCVKDARIPKAPNT